MLLVGLTGGIGAGKSTVGARLAAHGAVLIDSDVLAREVVAPGTPGIKTVVAEFGAQILTDNGEVDRAQLAELVFSDTDARSRLNQIMHPLVRERAAMLSAAAPADAVVVHDIPLLVENGLAPQFDVVVVVEAPLLARLAWLTERGLNNQEARHRIAAQATDEQRRGVADVLLRNDGDIARLHVQVDDLWEWLVGGGAAER